MARSDQLSAETAAVLDQLETARESMRSAESAVAEYGRESVEQVADAVERADRLLDRYESDATGTGDFEAFITFQGEFAELVENLPEDIPAREAFEAANEAVDKRRLSTSDFETARDALSDARAVADRLETVSTARSSLDDARRAVSNRIDTLDAEIAELERIASFADVDPDAPIDRLREPVTAYNDCAGALFTAVRRSVPARELLAVLDDTAAFPLVPFESPPEELREYLATAAVGTEPVPTLIEYDDYSRSKLGHYVDDPGQFAARVAVHRTYLDRLSADPLLVGWPPPDADTLRYRADELVSVTARLRTRLDAAGGRVRDATDPTAVERARSLRELADEPWYDATQRAAVAETELTDRQRERLASGAIDDELDRLRAERERLRDALDERVK